MSVEADIGQKIKEAIDFYLTQADSARLAAQLISDYWGERDYRWLAESGVITQREADIMLGVSKNSALSHPDRLWNWGAWLRWARSHYAPGQHVEVKRAHGDAWSGTPYPHDRVKEILSFGGDGFRVDRDARAEIVMVSGAVLTIYSTGSGEVEDFILPVDGAPRGNRVPKRNSRKAKRTSRRAR